MLALGSCICYAELCYLELAGGEGHPSQPVQGPHVLSLGPDRPIDARDCSETGVPTQANCLVEQLIRSYLVRKPPRYLHDSEKLPSEASTKKHCRMSALPL